MNRNDWYETGEQIKKLVQDAVDSRDFSQLGDTITDVVNQTVDGLQSVLKETLGSGADRHREPGAQQGADGREPDGAQWYQKTNREAAERIRRRMHQMHQREAKERESRQYQNSEKQKQRSWTPARKRLKVPGEISGRVLKWSGYSMSVMFGLSFAILGITGITAGLPVAVPAGILAVLFGASFGMGMSGRQKLGLAKRFRRYQEILGERTYCLVEELASAIGQSCRYVQKDLKKMIRRGYFREGYLDRRETLLITDRTTYQQYLSSQAEYEKRMMQETSKSARAEKTDTKQEETQQMDGSQMQYRELMEEGRQYIWHVHECNVKIEDEEMSAKLDRLELVITRIFRTAEKNPDVVPELKKMMSYYLPTTRKLLDAYCELDEQPVGGQNIQNTKKEIEAALDTINTAFEKLLDDLFEETAWDISSDISVLQTMLAQEGLTGGHDFK